MNYASINHITTQFNLPPAKLAIPAIRSKIRICEPWTFNLIDEYRNHRFWEKILPGVPHEERWSYNRGKNSKLVTLEPGTILTIDRIYIKKSSPNFNSISFFVETCPNLERSGSKKGKTHGRFWARLSEVNKIIGQWDTSSLP